MNCSIIQPHYFPWIGYFNLINSADYFVFLDDVKFHHQSWQHRNKILLNNNKSCLLTVPIKKTTGKFINDIIVDDGKNWRKKHFQTISQNYSKHPFFEDVATISGNILNNKLVRLADLNTAIILDLIKRLSIKTNFIFSSDLKMKGEKTDRIIEILRHLRCTKYFSNIGSKDYLFKDEFEKKSNRELVFNKASFEDYKQLNSKNFFPNLSIIDTLGNLGFKGLKKYLNNCKLN